MPDEKMRWPLPTVVHPPDTICFKVHVPNDRAYIGAFYGAIYALTYSQNWARDTAHTAADVSRVWTAIFDELLAGECEIPQHVLHGTEVEEFMPLRVDCDCNVFITCCDGTEAQILTADQVRALLAGQPGTATPPPAGGGCRNYNGKIGAAAPWFLPPVVSDGDTIEIIEASGAWNDGGEIPWRLYTGDRSFNGANIGQRTTVGSDPLPAAPHMALIAQIDGTFYDLSAGAVTVPGGVSNAQVTLQANDDPLSNNAGDISFILKVCNNQPLLWHHVFDFTVNSFADLFTFPQHGYLLAPMGHYEPGTGYVGDYVTATDGKGFHGILMSLAEVIDYTEARVDFTIAAGTYASVSTQYSFEYNYYPGPTSHNQVTLPTMPTSPQIDGTPISSTNLEIQFLTGLRDDGADPGGNVVLQKLTISGSGTDPFI